MAAPALSEQLHGELLRVAEKRSGQVPDLQSGESHSGLPGPFGSVQFDFSQLLLEGPVFEEALMNRHVLALITYLLGESCQLSHMQSMIKGPGGPHVPLHADQNMSGAPAPFPSFAQTANATWVLTDYSIQCGATCFVPGSHKLCRPPTTTEATNLDLFQPVECPAGSVLIWHGNTWHGRTTQSARPENQPHHVLLSLVREDV